MTGRFEVTLKALLLHEGRALVLRDRLSGQGDLPGGRITQDELHRPWLEALRRELREELGDVSVELQGEPDLVFPHILPTSRGDAVGMLWVGRWLGGEICLSDEHDHHEWVPLSEVPRRFRETLGEAVRRLLSCRPDRSTPSSTAGAGR